MARNGSPSWMAQPLALENEPRSLPCDWSQGSSTTSRLSAPRLVQPRWLSRVRQREGGGAGHEPESAHPPGLDSVASRSGRRTVSTNSRWSAADG